MKTFLFICLFVALSPLAFGQCNSPSGIGGQFQWFSGEARYKWCNNFSWINPTLSNGSTCAGSTPGSLTFFSGDYFYCDGLNWKGVKGPMITSCLGEVAGSLTWDPMLGILKFCDGAYWYAMYNPLPPSMISLSVNSGASSTRLNNVKIALSASSTDSVSWITHFCLKFSNFLPGPSTPASSDPCWMAVNLPSPGITPAPSINFSNYFYLLGFSPGTYYIFAWVRNGLGQTSTLSNSGNGTNGVDVTSIIYNPDSPPLLINVFATNSNSSAIPPTFTDLAIPAGSDVFIKWKLTDDRPLPSAPVTLSYTTDEVNFTTIATGVTNSANSGCTIDGVNSTGCYRWATGAPTSGYFKIRVAATDDSSLTSIVGAEPNNMSQFKVLAGSTDPGLGGSAASAVFYTTKDNHFSGGTGNMVVRDNGTVYVIDTRGLMTIDPLDGKYKLFLPVTGTRNDGALSSATLAATPAKIALDFNDRLLIYDSDRIRRVDFITNQITSIIGGGGSRASGVLASDFDLSPAWGGYYSYYLFTPLPNGDIWFQSGADNFYPQGSGFKARIYKASDNRIYQWLPTGTGSLEDPAFDPTNYATFNMGIAFNPITSQVTAVRTRTLIPVSGGHIPRSTSYHPSTGVSTPPHIPYLGYWTDDNTITSRNGEMYGVDRFQLHGLFKYNPSTNAWVRLIGTGIKGQCPDNTPALSCNTEITSAYINGQNQIFFIDRDRIRTLDQNGRVITLFGQSLTFGDGGFAANARINTVFHLDRTSGGKIAFADNNEFVIREFTPEGTISLLAGNGADDNPDTVNPAVSQPVSVKYWGAHYPFYADQSSGDLYYTRGGYNLSRLNRASGRWDDFAGGGGTHYMDADGLAGNQINFAGYPMGPVGYNGTVVLRHSHQWNGLDIEHAFIKTHTITTGTQAAFAGKTGNLNGSIDSCADGVVLTTCAVSHNHNSLSRSYWDGPNGRWLLHHVGSASIRTAVQGGTWGTLVTLPRGAESFTYVIKSSVPHVYYCSGGRVYRYNLNTSTEVALNWPSPSITCNGHSMIYHPTRQSVVFPIKQNGLGAIAEIKDP